MKTLLLDSTYKDLNVGLDIDGVMHKICYECFQRQSELMISEIDKILKENTILN